VPSVDLNINIRTRGAKTAGQGVKNVGDQAKAAVPFLKQLQRAVVGLFTLAAANQVRLYADSYLELRNRLRTVTETTQDLDRVTKDLADVARETRTEFALTAELYARVARSTEELGVSSKRTTRFVELVNKVIQASGVNAREAEAGLIQFSQGLASNRLAGDELKSVLEGVPELGRQIAKGLGVAFGQLRELGARQELTTEKVFNAILKQQAEIEVAFEKVDVSVTKSLTNLETSFIQFVGKLDTATGFSAKLAGAIDALAGSFDLLAAAIAGTLAGYLAFQAVVFIQGVTLSGALRKAIIGLALAFTKLNAAAGVAAGILTTLFSVPVLIGGLAAATVAVALFGEEIDKITGLPIARTFQQTTIVIQRVVTRWIELFAKAIGQIFDIVVAGAKKAARGFALVFFRVLQTILTPRLRAFLNRFGGLGSTLGNIIVDGLRNNLAGSKSADEEFKKALDGLKGTANDFRNALSETFEDVKNEFRQVPGENPGLDLLIDKMDTAGAAADKNGDKIAEFFRKLKASVAQVGLSDLELKSLQALEQFRGAAGRAATKGPGGEEERIRSLVAERERGLEALKEEEAIQANFVKRLEEQFKAEEDARKKRRQDAQKLLDEIDPLGAARRQFAEDRSTLISSGRERGLSVTEIAAEVKKVEEARKDALKPLETTIEALEDQLALTKLTGTAAKVEGEFQQVSNQLKKAGVDLSEEARAADAKRIRELIRQRQEVEEQKRVFKELSEELNRSLVRSLEKATNQLAEFLVSGKRGALDFSNILRSLATQLAQIALQRILFRPLLSGLGIQQFASGGVINRPTLFQNGGTLGLAGEAGREAILPLRRTKNGDLGVVATGDGGGMGSVTVNVVQNFNGSDGGNDSELSEQGRLAAHETGRVVEGVVRNVIQKQQRPGGDLNRQAVI
jgi:tape measure domain-containing protein